MTIRPVDILWQILRNDETRSSRITFTFVWKDATWCSETGTAESLASLHKTHGTPVETRITDVVRALTSYRCNICGGLVQFDGAPPEKDQPCSSPSATTG